MMGLRHRVTFVMKAAYTREADARYPNQGWKVIELLVHNLYDRWIIRESALEIP